MLAVAALGISREAMACPECATARVVRASLFDDRFWGHLGLIALPLVVLSLIVVALYRVGLSAPSASAEAVTQGERS